MGINYIVQQVCLGHPIRLAQESLAPLAMSLEFQLIPKAGVEFTVGRAADRTDDLNVSAKNIENHKLRVSAADSGLGGEIAFLNGKLEDDVFYPNCIEIIARISFKDFSRMIRYISSHLIPSEVIVEFDKSNTKLSFNRDINDKISLNWFDDPAVDYIQSVNVLSMLFTYKKSL